LVLWSSRWTVFVKTESSRWILCSAVTLVAGSFMIFRHSPLQCTAIPFTEYWFSTTIPLSWRRLPMTCVCCNNLANGCSGLPNIMAVSVTSAPAKRAPTVYPLWKSDKPAFVQCFLTNCLLNTIRSALKLALYDANKQKNKERCSQLLVFHCS
jgi:hypothetical protein